MSKSRTPNYSLIESYTYYLSPGDSLTLPAGTFVRPIELTYVPKHVLEDPRKVGFNKEAEVYCYCRHGIIAIPRKIIKESL